MTRYTDADARVHPAYDDSLRRAAERAFADNGEHEYAVYYDGTAVFVRAVEAAPPSNATRICIAQRWDKNTVQLRFAGARSEWVRM